MNCSVILPCKLPVFSSYHYQMCGMVPAMASASGYNWYLNECIQLSCSENLLSGYDQDGVIIENSSFLENPHLEIKYVDEIGNWDSIISGIRDALAHGRYVYFCGADDYYLPGKSNYGEEHVSHDGLIYGCDDEKAELSVMAYSSNWVCRGFPILYENFRKSLQNIIDGAKRWFGFFAYIKAGKETVPLDVFRIHSQLCEYLDSNIGKFPYAGPGRKYGIVVHDYICRLLELACDGYLSAESLDLRLLRVIWEHKRCMMDRLQALDGYFNEPGEFSGRYDRVVDLSDRARMIFARNSVRPDSRLPRLIISDLQELKAYEAGLLEKVCTSLSARLKNL